MSPADGNPEQTAAVHDPAGEHSHQVGLPFAASGRNKLWPGVNLARPEGLDLLAARLRGQSDVVLTNALPEARGSQEPGWV